MIMNTDSSYGLVAKALHWAIALLIFGLFAVGLYMTGLADDDSSRSSIYALHKATGSLLMFLGLFRIVWVIISPPPPAPLALAKTDVKIQKAVIGMLYLFVLAIPLSGFLMSQFKGYGIDFFGIFDIPVLFSKSKSLGEFFEESHEILAFLTIGIVALHLLGALKHRLKDRGGETDILSRML